MTLLITNRPALILLTSGSKAFLTDDGRIGVALVGFDGVITSVLRTARCIFGGALCGIDFFFLGGGEHSSSSILIGELA
jgi:hypothetical protein